jgi:hypothetical protein
MWVLGLALVERGLGRDVAQGARRRRAVASEEVVAVEPVGGGVDDLAEVGVIVGQPLLWARLLVRVELGGVAAFVVVLCEIDREIVRRRFAGQGEHRPRRVLVLDHSFDRCPSAAAQPGVGQTRARGA